MGKCTSKWNYMNTLTFFKKFLYITFWSIYFFKKWAINLCHSETEKTKNWRKICVYSYFGNLTGQYLESGQSYFLFSYFSKTAEFDSKWDCISYFFLISTNRNRGLTIPYSHWSKKGKNTKYSLISFGQFSYLIWFLISFIFFSK